MWAFLLVVLAIYGAMNSYLLWKVWTVFPGLGHARIAIACFLVLMVLAPVIVHNLDRGRNFRLAGACAAVGYVWMAVIFWFCVLALAGDAWNLLVRAAGAMGAPVRAALLPPRSTMAGIGGLVAAALGWGLLEARAIRVEGITVEIPGLPASMDGLKVAQISDLHLGVHTGQGRLDKAIRLVEQARPDVLVCTGDLADSPLDNVRPMAEALRAVRPPLGKFAVLGNHEFYLGLKDSLGFLDLAGFRVLRREAVTVGGGLRIAGVDDPAGRRTGLPDLTDEEAVLPPAKAAATILLKHQPLVREASLGRFDLQLSGHAHGGQIFPWHLVTRLTYRFYSGLHALPGGSALYASRGTGTWGPPVRLLATPEVTLITLKAAK